MEQLVLDGYLIEYELAEIVQREGTAKGFNRRGMNSWIKTSSNIVDRTLKTLEAEANKEDLSIDRADRE